MVGEMEGYRDQDRQIQREKEGKDGETTEDKMSERAIKRCDRHRAKA